MIKLVPFKLVFRGEQVWINPDHVVYVQKRVGMTSQACIRLAHQGDAEDIVVDGGVEEVIRKLTGKAPEPTAKPQRSFALDSEAMQALEGAEPRVPS